MVTRGVETVNKFRKSNQNGGYSARTCAGAVNSNIVDSFRKPAGSVAEMPGRDYRFGPALSDGADHATKVVALDVIRRTRLFYDTGVRFLGRGGLTRLARRRDDALQPQVRDHVAVVLVIVHVVEGQN
jgi:hypothetical protein